MSAGEPRTLRSFKTDPEREAWREGWNVASAQRRQHERPNYLTNEEREAFKHGWEAWWDRNTPVRIIDADDPISN